MTRTIVRLTRPGRKPCSCCSGEVRFAGHEDGREKMRGCIWSVRKWAAS